MHAKVGMAVQPAPDAGMFVGGIVIHDHVDLLVFGNDVIDGAQELQPLLMTVPVVAHGNDLAFQGIQRGKHRVAVPLRL